MEVDESVIDIFNEELNFENNIDISSSITSMDSDKIHEEHKFKALCKYCKKSLSKVSINRHQKVCSENPQKTSPPPKTTTTTCGIGAIEFSRKTTTGLCKFCKKSIAKSKINRHQDICSANPQQNYASKKFTCDICDVARFSRKDNLNAHIRKCKTGTPPKIKPINCLYNDCIGQFSTKTLLIEHLKEYHKSEIENPQELNFTSFSDFEKWKEKKEEMTFSYFSKQFGSKNGKAYYYCQHDGHSKPHRKTGQPAHKTSRKQLEGHIKQGRVCIAMIKLAVNDDGSCAVKYFPSHSHPLSMKDWKHQPQKKSVYKSIDQQIALQISPSTILQNIRDVNKSPKGEENSTKLKLLTRNLIRKRASKFHRPHTDHDDYILSPNNCAEALNDEDHNQIAVNLGILDLKSGDVYNSKIMNITKDLHVCGGCRKIFNEIQLFLDHKQKCHVTENNETLLPSTNDTLSENDLFYNQTMMDLSVLESGSLSLDLYYDNEEVVGDNIALQSQEDISPQDEINEILTTGQIINGEDVSNHLSSEVIIKDISRNEPIDESTGENLNTGQTNGSVYLADNNSYEKETVGELIPDNKAAKKCSTCNFATFNHRDFLRHMRKHTGERPYKCCYCDKAFARQDKLAVHKRIHLGDKQFKCQVCEYATIDSGALRRHLLIHTDERPFKCQLCPYRARNASHISVHLRTHTGDSPFFCQHAGCSRTFKTNSDLKRHMKEHKPDSWPSPTLPSDDTMERCSFEQLSKGKGGKRINKSCYGCETHAVRGTRRRRGRRGGRRQAACQKTQECQVCSASFVRPDSLRSHMRLHQINTPPPNEPSELDEDKPEKEDNADSAASQCQLEVLNTEEEAKEVPTPLFFISSVDCPESLMPLVQDGTIHYIEDTSYL